MSFYARARGEAASRFGRFPQEAVGASVGSAVFSSAPRLIAEAKQTKSNTATRLRKLCNFLPSCAILRLIRWTNARMVTGILFFFIDQLSTMLNRAIKQVSACWYYPNFGQRSSRNIFFRTLVGDQSQISERFSCAAISAVR